MIAVDPHKASNTAAVLDPVTKCSVNGMPEQARSPHRCSRAYSMSSTGPRTLRSSIDPRAGRMVRLM